MGQRNGRPSYKLDSSPVSSGQIARNSSVLQLGHGKFRIGNKRARIWSTVRKGKSKWQTHEGERTEGAHRGRITRSSFEVPEQGGGRKRRLGCSAELDASKQQGEEPYELKGGGTSERARR